MTNEAAPSKPGLLSPIDEGRAFGQLRARMLRNQFRQLLAESRLRLVLVVVLSTLFWLGLFWLFFDAFRFLQHSITSPSILDQTVRATFGVFFVSLMVMLVFSAGIVLYGGLYRTREVRFLLTLPVRAERIFLHKFQETMVFSSWGFVLLGSPLLVAYGLASGAPWYYYLLIWPLIVAFAYVPGSIGAICCMLVAHFLPRRRLTALGIAGVAVLGLGVVITLRLVDGWQGQTLTAHWFQGMLNRLQFSQSRLLPSWWFSTSLIETAAGQWSEGVMLASLTVANALFFHQVATWTSGRFLRAGYDRLHDQRSLFSAATGRTLKRRFPIGAIIERLVTATVFFLPRQMQQLITKDLRLFLRDPVQWSQFLIFFGLLGSFFANIRRLSYDIHHVAWVNMVSFLNLAAVGLIMSTFTSRFIFPAISLEGRRFWILGRLPIRRETILWSKFLFAAIGSIIPCGALILLSDVMLGVVPWIVALHLLTCLLLCMGLSGIAVGLGAKMPNLREESPTKIAAGFGGTLNLVISAMYIVVIVVLTAVPCHFYLMASQAGEIKTMVDPRQMQIWIVAALAASIGLSAAATWIPMKLGFRAFSELEF
jgi:ABC-2 type transport system permease protein